MPARKTALSLGMLLPLLGLLAACAGAQGPQLSGPDGPMISNNDWNEHNYGMGYYSGPYNDGFEAEGLDGGPPDYMGDAFFTGP